MDVKRLLLYEADCWSTDLQESDPKPINKATRLKCLRKYFQKWQTLVKQIQEKRKSEQLKLEQKQKLDLLIKALKKHQKEQDKADQPPPIIEKPKSSSTSFKNRFEAQKMTIKQLNSKLEQKDRLIDELHLGIINKDVLQAINNTKFEIRQIFADCSTKVRCKVAPPIDYNEEFRLSTQQAPKMAHKMEERALERAQKREIIQKRRQLIDEARKKALEEAVAKKRAMEEAEKKAHLEKMKERRRIEVELEKIRQINKAIYFEKLKKAIDHRTNKIIKYSYVALRFNQLEARRKVIKAQEHEKAKLLQKSLNKWTHFVELQYEGKNLLADALFAGKILHRALLALTTNRIECKSAMQVAEDFCDFCMQKNAFINWHRQTCRQIMQSEKKLKVARRHYNQRIIVQYFYQWRALPAVMQLERAKEQKKKRWREKVWEILPDYKPPNDLF